MKFVAHFDWLDPHNHGFGEIGILPWDEKVFAFPVAELRKSSLPDIVAKPDHFVTALTSWSALHDVRLVSFRTSERDLFWNVALSAAGFFLVDLNYIVVLEDMPDYSLSSLSMPFRPATKDDQPAIEKIAATAFNSGRYHSDPLFSRELANKRYVQWIRNAFEEPELNEHLYVMEANHTVAGFHHFTLKDNDAHLQLTAVSSKYRFGGGHLFRAAIALAKEMGATRIHAVISAWNIRVMKVYTSMGFHVEESESVFHWHPESARRLLL